MFKTGETVLEIDLDALEHNYHYLRSQVDKGCQVHGGG
jgi:alanine racemase